MAEPLHRLTRKGVPWRWESEEDQAFQRLKTLLSSDKVLVHFDPTLPVGISCIASNVGIGAVLFHCFRDGSERPIANVSKFLTRSQHNCSQIQKEAMAIVYALIVCPEVYHCDGPQAPAYAFWTGKGHALPCCELLSALGLIFEPAFIPDRLPLDFWTF